MKKMKLSFFLIIMIGFTNAYTAETKQPMHPVLVVGETILFPALPNYQIKQYRPAIIQTAVDVVAVTAPFLTSGSYENMFIAAGYGILAVTANRLISIPINLNLSKKAGKISNVNFRNQKSICLAFPVSSTPGIRLLINH